MRLHELLQCKLTIDLFNGGEFLDARSAWLGNKYS
jgi:hypothetical protein